MPETEPESNRSAEILAVGKQAAAAANGAHVAAEVAKAGIGEVLAAIGDLSVQIGEAHSAAQEPEPSIETAETLEQPVTVTSTPPAPITSPPLTSAPSGRGEATTGRKRVWAKRALGVGGVACSFGAVFVIAYGSLHGGSAPEARRTEAPALAVAPRPEHKNSKAPGAESHKAAESRATHPKAKKTEKSATDTSPAERHSSPGTTTQPRSYARRVIIRHNTNSSSGPAGSVKPAATPSPSHRTTKNPGASGGAAYKQPRSTVTAAEIAKTGGATPTTGFEGSGGAVVPPDTSTR